MMKIIVESEEIKQKLLKESEYIHDFCEVIEDSSGYNRWIGLDSDEAGMLMHIYMNPDMIIVEK